MSTLSLGWSISMIEPAIDRCRKFCSAYADNGDRVFHFGDLIRQLGRLESAYQDLQHQPPVNKIYINFEAITKTLEQCQVFLNQHQASLHQEWTDLDLHRNADLIEGLKLHTQTLEVYRSLLKILEGRLSRRSTLPSQSTPLVDSILPDREPLSVELNEVKQLRFLLNESSDKIKVSHLDAADRVSVELANIAEALEGQITRSQNKARLAAGLHNNQQTQDIVEQNASGRRPSVQTHADSVIDRTASIISTSSGIAASLQGATPLSTYTAAEAPAHELIPGVKTRFRIADNPKQEEVLCSLDATFLGNSLVAIAVLPENDRQRNLPLPVLNFCSSLNRPIPIMRWRGGRTQEGEHVFVVTLSSTDCLQGQESLSDLEYRFDSEPACKHFLGMVYGKVLGEFVNVHKLQWEDDRRRKNSLCETSVIYFWHDRANSGKQLADYTMLYFENSRVSQAKELQLRDVKVPRPNAFGKNGARLCLVDGRASVLFEFSRQNGQRDLEKLRQFLLGFN